MVYSSHPAVLSRNDCRSFNSYHSLSFWSVICVISLFTAWISSSSQKLNVQNRRKGGTKNKSKCFFNFSLFQEISAVGQSSHTFFRKTGTFTGRMSPFCLLLKPNLLVIFLFVLLINFWIDLIFLVPVRCRIFFPLYFVSIFLQRRKIMKLLIQRYLASFARTRDQTSASQPPTERDETIMSSM